MEDGHKLFLAAMEDSSVGVVTRNVMYRAVKTFGEDYWKANAAAKAQGEKRFLREYPPDPLISWDNWRKRSEV